MFEMIDALVQGVLGLAIFFGVIYAFVKTIIEPIHQKLDRLLAAYEELATRVADLEADTAKHI
jgi:hypothetical protein